jgi:hypothetical protein
MDKKVPDLPTIAFKTLRRHFFGDGRTPLDAELLGASAQRDAQRCPTAPHECSEGHRAILGGVD